MATRVDVGGGFERVLPARSGADARPRGKASSWAWTVPAAGLGILFLCLFPALAREEGTSFLSSRFRTRRDLVDVGGVDEVTRPPAVTSALTEPSEPPAASRTPAEATAQDWSMLLPDVETDARVFASRGAHATLGFACYSSPIPRADTERVAITRFEPVTTREDSVHHITVFGCDARVQAEHGGVTFGQDCAAWQFARAPSDAADSSPPPCRVIVYAYDKGADAFEAPDGTAVHVGEGTGITHVLYQVHYLAPLPRSDGGGAPAGDVSRTGSRPEPWRDASGVRFSLRFAGDLRAASRTTPIGILATMHTRMRLPANERRVRFEYAVGPFSARMAPDFALAVSSRGGKNETSALDDDAHASGARVTLVAAHMHGHGMLERYEFGVLRPATEGGGGARRVPIGVLEGYGGYGADQSFMALPTRRTLNSPNGDSESPRDSAARGRAETVGVAMAPGDSMYVRCTFDTRAASNESRVPRAFVPYGVGHGEEMCGQLVYYYPFAADVGAAGEMRRPEPRDDDVDGIRDNELFNVFFGDDARVNTTIER